MFLRCSAFLAQAIEERVDEVRLPLENELAAAYAGHQEEKALRESDRRYTRRKSARVAGKHERCLCRNAPKSLRLLDRCLADLWPEGWLMPSMLRRFRTMNANERAQRTQEMEEMEAERDLVEGIRAGVAAAAKVFDNVRKGEQRWRSSARKN